MIILVLSDSHTDVDTMDLAFAWVKPDVVVHLGDSVIDAVLLQSRHRDVRFEMVRGNVDTGSGRPDELLVTLDGIPVLIAHGDQYHVETGLGVIARAAAERGARLALHGHTHVPCIETVEGVTVMNPGRVGRVSSKKINASFGIIRTNGADFCCEIVYVNDICGG